MDAETTYQKHRSIYDDLKARGHILFETVIGSQAHGTATPKSDVDTSFVYMAPKEWLYNRSKYHDFLRLSKDYIGYELEYFLHLVATNNPTVFECLFTSEDCWVMKNVPIYDIVQDRRNEFISKVAQHSYLGYAASQITKAKGMEKFQNWSKDRTTKKDPIDFCWVIDVKKGHDTMPLQEFMGILGINEADLGVTNVNHAPNVFSLFLGIGYKGVFGKNSDKILFSSVPKEEESIALMVYNQDAYKMHSKDWKRYMKWKENANKDRWVQTSDGNHIDAKNIMHFVRLMQMNREIASGKGCIVRRPNRDELLVIRNGGKTLDEVLEWAEQEKKDINFLYDESSIRPRVDMDMVDGMLLEMREKFYALSEEDNRANTTVYDNKYIHAAIAS